MPKLWDETIDSHRRAVRDATLDATAALVAERGLLSVTMSQIANTAGIGRATLYKYFSEIEDVLVAWHERQVNRHLEELTAARDRAVGPRERLENVLETYAMLSHRHDSSDLASLLHRGEHVAHAQQELHGFVRDLLSAGVASGDFRDDVPSGELASFCLHALSAAASLPSKAAVRRLVSVTIAGIRVPR
ncbi:MAG: TetR/AcrR family transcriptional regulator [Solirubrobacterales bacterium]